MNVFETLCSRRTIHDYLAKAIPPAAIKRALEAAIQAPNHKLTNPWRFTRVGPETRQRIVDQGVQIKCAGKDVSEQKKSKVRKKLSASPELIVVSQVILEDPVRYKEDYAAIACAIQNMMLSLWSEGIGSKWSSGKITTHEQTYGILEIDPEIEEIVGFVWIGYPEHIPRTARMALDEVYRQTP